MRRCALVVCAAMAAAGLRGDGLMGVNYYAPIAHAHHFLTNRNFDVKATHYLNLVYTPDKAISLAIAAEAMARLPKGGEPGVTWEPCATGRMRSRSRE